MKWREIGGNCITRSSQLVLLTKHNYNDQVKEGEMVRAWSTKGGDEECI
jgi:hypothetical protein